jgi:hypothetical protein
MKNTNRISGPKATRIASLAPLALAAAVNLLATSAASAQPSGGGQRQGPPAAALAACKSLTTGATCGFSGPQGTVAGTCFAPQQSLPLACRPKDAPAQGGSVPVSK